ncbi:hypothetical protein AJ87_32580 [Rhizobium yanglingense]|nr:hypothetical protein AJ87_32580 [Rhizobium yanglingense]
MVGDRRGDGTDEGDRQEVVAVAEAEHDTKEIGGQQDIKAERLRAPMKLPSSPPRRLTSTQGT